MAMALLAFATGGCVDPLDDSLKPQPEEPTLTFWIHVPGAMQAATKAQTGDVASINPESTLYDVQVWVFEHGTTKLLNYVDEDNITPAFEFNPSYTESIPKVDADWQASHKIQVPLPKEFILGPQPGDSNYNPDVVYQPLVDIYILANWRSIFATKPQPTTLAAVKDLVFGVENSSNFGTGDNPTIQVPKIDNKYVGLPISAVEENVDLTFLKQAYNGEITLTNDVFKSQIGVIELERAVAKVRFVFAKTENMTGEITKIVIGQIDSNGLPVLDEGKPVGKLIPNSMYAFPRTQGSLLPSTEESSYGGGTILAGEGTNPLLSSDDIIAVTDPELLRSDYPSAPDENTPAPLSMKAQDYEDYLTSATSDIQASTAKLVYFRESDRRITGTIYYKVNGVEKTAKFDMADVVSYDPETGRRIPYNAETTNLHRNHYWTVYAYFKGDGLYITPVALPWVNGGTFNFTTPGTAVVKISTKSEALFGYGYTTSIDNTWNYVDYTGVVTEYSWSDNSTLGAWSTTTPTDFTTNKYFWVRTGISLSDGRTLYSPVVAKGPKVVNTTTTYNVTGISVQYAVSSSDSVSPTSGWSSGSPVWDVNNPFVWVKVTTSYSDDTTVDDVVCVCNKNDLYVSPTTTEWYFRRQSWSSGNEYDLTRPNDNNSYYAWHDWFHSQMVVAPGTNLAGLPIYANRIELVTNGFASTDKLYLKLTDDTHFDIITYDLSTGVITRTTSATQGALVKTNGTTYFYVIPKNGDGHEAKMTAAYLTVVPEGGSSQKLPFNSGLFPGSNDNTEIFFYSVPVDTFIGYYISRPDNIKPYTYEANAPTPAHEVII